MPSIGLGAKLAEPATIESMIASPRARAVASTAAATIAGEAMAWAPRADSAALKVSGTQVWSGGEVAPADAEAVTLRSGESYRRLWWRDGRLVGAVLYGDTAETGFYQGLIASGRAVASRADAALGQAFLQDAA